MGRLAVRLRYPAPASPAAEGTHRPRNRWAVPGGARFWVIQTGFIRDMHLYSKRAEFTTSSETHVHLLTMLDEPHVRWARMSFPSGHVTCFPVSPPTASQGASSRRGQGLLLSGHCGSSCPPSPDARPEPTLPEALAGCSVGGGRTLGCRSGQEPQRRTTA